MAELSLVRPVTASKSQACREEDTSGPCPWLFSAARPVGAVKSLKALLRYNVVKAPAFAKAAARQANDEHARAGAARVGGNAARVAGTSPGEVNDQCSCPGISYEQSVELEFGFGLLPGNQRFASVFGDCCFEIAEVFEIFDTLLKSSHGLIECLDLFENGGVTHKLPFDLLQHKLESCRGPTNDEARITNDEGMTKHE